MHRDDIHVRDENQSLFVTLHTSRETERLVADKISSALHCRTVTFKEILSNVEKIPPTQTRIAFHGHGDAAHFGSMDHNLTPDEFADEISKVLAQYPHIKDIDLLSCNLGLIDSSGKCYASIVQDRLDKIGLSHVNINTFMVDNKNDTILDSFFVVGMSDDLDSSFLKSNQFCLDIISKDDETLISIHKQIKDIEAELYFCNVKIDLLAAIRNVCRSDEVSMENLQKEMALMGYNEKIYQKIVSQYEVKAHLSDEVENYFTCNMINPVKKYMYRKDAQEDIYLIERQLPELHKRNEALSREFATLRSTSPKTRMFVSEISNIPSFLASMRSFANQNLYAKIQELQILKTDRDPKLLAKLIIEIANAHKDNPQTQALDLYAKNLALQFLSYKSSNPQRTLALNQLAMNIGIIYAEHLHGHVSIDDCITKLKTNVIHICDAIRENHKATGTLSFPSFPGGGFALTGSSLARNLGSAMVKSDKELAVLIEKLTKQETLKTDLKL